MSVLAVPDSAREVVRKHVNPDPPLDCIRELARLIRERDFGWGFASHFLTVAAWACAWADGQFVDPAVFGRSEDPNSRSELYAALCELEEAVTGNPPAFRGPITDALIGQLVKSLLEALVTEQNMQWLIDFINGLLN
jgi:hypothetical protein